MNLSTEFTCVMSTRTTHRKTEASPVRIVPGVATTSHRHVCLPTASHIEGAESMSKYGVLSAQRPNARDPSLSVCCLALPETITKIFRAGQHENNNKKPIAYVFLTKKNKHLVWRDRTSCSMSPSSRRALVDVKNAGCHLCYIPFYGIAWLSSLFTQSTGRDTTSA